MTTARRASHTPKRQIYRNRREAGRVLAGRPVAQGLPAVMAHVHKAVVKSGGLGRLVRDAGGGAGMDATLRREDFVSLLESLTEVTKWPVSRQEAHQIYNRLDPNGKDDVPQF